METNVILTLFGIDPSDTEATEKLIEFLLAGIANPLDNPPES